MTLGGRGVRTQPVWREEGVLHMTEASEGILKTVEDPARP